MDELLEQPAGTLDSEAVGNTGAEDHIEAPGDDVDGLPGDGSQDAEEDVEFEVGERKLALPKSVAEQLKSERMMHADYTQKTQSVAAERTKLGEERQQMVKQQQEAQKHIDNIADVRAIDKQLKAIDDLNLSQYVDSDPQGVMKVQEQRRALESQRSQLVNDITQKQNEYALNEQQSFAKQVQDAEAYLTREIKGISKERLDAMQAYATAQGIDAQTYARAIITQPAFAKFVHKAELYDALMAKNAPKPAPKPEAKPAIKVGTTASVQKDPAKMTDKEFAAWRKSQIKNRQ